MVAIEILLKYDVHLMYKAVQLHNKASKQCRKVANTEIEGRLLWTLLQTYL